MERFAQSMTWATLPTEGACGEASVIDRVFGFLICLMLGKTATRLSLSILGEMDVLPKRRLNKRSSISNSIAGKSIAVDCLSYQQ